MLARCLDTKWEGTARLAQDAVWDDLFGYKEGEMKDIYVADLGKFENQSVVAFFAATSKQLRSRKDGGQYLAVTFGDRTGQVESRMWDNFAEARFRI